MANRAPEVFLSHSSKDTAATEMLRQKIEEWGYRCFCDHYDIGPGVSWEESILDALRQSVALVVFASPAAMESKWVFAEIHIARYAKKPIFFLVTDRDTQIPPHLTTIQFIDASNRSGGLAFLDQLRQALPQHPTHAPQPDAGSQQPIAGPGKDVPSSRPRDLARESRQLARRVLELLEPRRRQSEGDAERGLLLALAAVEEYTWTPEAERALLTGLLVSKLTGRLIHDQAGLLDARVAGSRVVTVGAGTASVWQLPECHFLRRFAGRITAAQLSADGKILIAGDQGGHLKRWSLDNGKLESTLDVHEAPIVQLVLFADGACCTVAEGGQAVFTRPRGEIGPVHEGIVEETPPTLGANGLVALVREDATIALHGTDGALRSTLNGHQRLVTSCSFDASGTRLASGAEDGVVLLWDALTGNVIRRFEPLASGVRQISMSPDGRLVAVTTLDRVVRIWEDSGKLLCTLPRGALEFDRAWLISDDELVTACVENSAQLWNIHGTLLQRFVGHSGLIHTVVSCPEHHRILTASADGSVLVWSAQVGTERVRLQHQGYSVERCLFAPDGKPVTATADGLLYVWSPEGKQLLRSREHSKPVSLATATNGYLLTAAVGEAVRLWKIGQPRPEQSFGVAGAPRAAALSADGNSVAWANAEGIITLASTSDPHSARELAGHGSKVVSLAFSRDGQRLLSASEDGSACVWHTSSGIRQLQLRPSGFALAQACFDPRDRRILTVSAEPGPVWIWDAQSGTKLFALRDHEEVITDAAYSLCGRWIATASRDKTIRLWNAETGIAHALPLKHDDVPLRICFCPNGSRLAAGCRDGHALLWDTETGVLLARLTGHTSALTDIAFSSDGGELITASFDGTARIYSVPRREALIALAKQRVFRQLTDEERREHGLRSNENCSQVQTPVQHCPR